MLGDFANMTDIMSYQDYQTIAKDVADAVAKSLAKSKTKSPLAKLLDSLKGIAGILISGCLLISCCIVVILLVLVGIKM